MPDCLITRPITIIAPTIQHVLAGTCTTLHRPQGALSTCRAGDRLWIREQFRLPIRFDGISPLQALERGATPVLSADIDDLPAYATADLGRPRFAREMPRAWHRAHLVITSIDLTRLHTVTPAEAEAAGFAKTDHFGQAWNAGLRGFKSIRPPRWENNPIVLAISFTIVAAPVDAHRERTAA